MSQALFRRQNGIYGDNNDDGDYWGYSTTAIAIKWAFVGAILFLFLLWFVGGYYHAQRRLKRGLPPLRYHRFLLPYRQRMQYMPRPPNRYYPQEHGYSENYPMQNYIPPPPAYHADHVPPPVYQPPEGGSKVIPSQDWVAPPPGLPPGHTGAGASSSAMDTVSLGQAPVSQEQGIRKSVVQGEKPARLSRFNPFK